MLSETFTRLKFRVRCARSCMDFTRSVDNVELRKVRVDDDEALC